MIFDVFLFLIGLTLLSWGADKFIIGASGLAQHWGISPMLIGLTVIALGSSAPELLIAASASLTDHPNTAVGNALGSNVANIALVLGATATLTPLLVTSSTVKREFPLLITVTAIALSLLLDGHLSRLDGMILLLLFGGSLYALTALSRRASKSDKLKTELQQETHSDLPYRHAVVLTVAGMILLPISAHLMVTSAVSIATNLGVSDLVIGLTIIAVGTSLPELATCVAGARKKEHDMALGNIIGSNIFNISAVLAIPALLAPGAIDTLAIQRDGLIVMALTLMLVLLSINIRGKRLIRRWQGFFLLTLFAIYQTMLFTN